MREIERFPFLYGLFRYTKDKHGNGLGFGLPLGIRISVRFRIKVKPGANLETLLTKHCFLDNVCVGKRQ